MTNQSTTTKSEELQEQLVDDIMDCRNCFDTSALWYFNNAYHTDSLREAIGRIVSNHLASERTKALEDGQRLERERVELVIKRHLKWKPTEGYGSDEEKGFQKGLMSEAKLIAFDLDIAPEKESV